MQFLHTVLSQMDILMLSHLLCTKLTTNLKNLYPNLKALWIAFLNLCRNWNFGDNFWKIFAINLFFFLPCTFDLGVLSSFHLWLASFFTFSVYFANRTEERQQPTFCSIKTKALNLIYSIVVAFTNWQFWYVILTFIILAVVTLPLLLTFLCLNFYFYLEWNSLIVN